MAAAEPNYPASFYAKLFDVTERRIQQLAKDGTIPKAARGKYPLIGTIKGYVKFLQDRSLAKVADYSDTDIRAQKLRLTKAQADAQELKNEIALQQTVPTEFATYALAKIAAEASGVLDSVPLNLKRKHPELTTLQFENIKRAIAKASSAVVTLPEKLPDLLDEYIRETDS